MNTSRRFIHLNSYIYNHKINNMDLGKEFKKFAIKDQGISSTYFNDIISSMYPSVLKPNIIEEKLFEILKNDEKVMKYLDHKNIKRKIYIKDKLLNIII